MKLEKSLFERLNSEKKRAEETTLKCEIAITHLQNLCDHEWVEEEMHGGNPDNYCQICGVWERDMDTQKS